MGGRGSRSYTQIPATRAGEEACPYEGLFVTLYAEIVEQPVLNFFI